MGDTIAMERQCHISHTCLLYVLQKLISFCRFRILPGPDGAYPGTAREIIGQMIADRFDANGRCQLMSRLDLNRMHIDPEYNYYGCNGWSLSFNLQTASY